MRKRCHHVTTGMTGILLNSVRAITPRLKLVRSVFFSSMTAENVPSNMPNPLFHPSTDNAAETIMGLLNSPK